MNKDNKTEECNCESLKKEIGFEAVCKFHEYKHIESSPHKEVEGWERIAAKIALDAHKKSKHYAEFSEIIYQGISSLLSSQRQAVIEEIHGHFCGDMHLIRQKAGKNQLKLLSEVMHSFRKTINITTHNL